MKVREIRKRFLDYFAGNGHRVVASSSLVPHEDPTLLFVNAGMNQFKDVFLGLEKRDYKRATTVQKCVRAGGKHNDLENVGVTARHHTFFEMLGNFSFGDYFKKEAIDFAWEFLVDELGLDPERLQVTVFEGDDDVERDGEAHEYWRKYFPAEKIQELGKKDNFWSMGDTGPCGPCSEVHFFQGDHLPCEEPECLGVACECDRWLEIWNLVFMQFNRTEDGALTRLPAPSVDTGMGLERIAAVVQGVLSNYDTDLFTTLLETIGKRTGKTYRRSSSDDDVSLRVIADHARASTFLVVDGVMPANEGRGYVLRKIMRRAMRHGKKLGVDEPFLYELTEAVIEEMQDAYPDLLLGRELVRRVVHSEEERFSTTLATGIAALEENLARADVVETRLLPGADAFKLYDTFGMPLDLLEDIAGESGVTIDDYGFEKEMEGQRQKARESWKKSAAAPDRTIYGELRGRFQTRFDGYISTKEEGRVVAMTRDGIEVPELAEGDEGEVLLDTTPFYPEGGGQLGDRGVLAGPGGVADVVDTQSPVAGLIVHRVKITKGTLGADQRVVATVDPALRTGAAAHHTMTHMLHAALRETLGLHVKQAGSLVAPNRLRFDFSHFAPLTPGELEQIEGRVNEKIQNDLDVTSETLSIDKALARGAIAFFGEKYGDEVRIVEIPDFSLELCGGTHLRRTGEAGPFVITSESSVASGIRRIEALTGRAAVAHFRSQLSLIEDASKMLRARPEELAHAAERLRDDLKQKEREIETLKLKLATGASSSESESAETTVGDVLIWTPRPLEDFGKKEHRQVVDAFKDKHNDTPWVAVSTSVNDDKVSLIVEVSKELSDQLRADHLIKQLASIIEGRGGGKAERAEAGGRYPERLPELLERAREWVRETLEGQRV